MNKKSVFEYQSLKTEGTLLRQLQLFYKEKDFPYYDLINNGVKFKNYVGVIQVGKTVIEVLPKIDKSSVVKDKEKGEWRNALIFMLRNSNFLNIHSPSTSNLSLLPNSILDLYFEIFVCELEYLMHNGLVKKYYKVEGNKNFLKGSIQFAQHISKNLVHKERFYVKHSTYDKCHTLHAILYKALKLINNINTNVHLNGRIGALLLDFPEMKDIKISQKHFDKITFDRKTIGYKNVISIAKLILLNYHPNVTSGSNDVLALMFDMNLLWERFVYKSLQKFCDPNVNVLGQESKVFWEPDVGSVSHVRPDIVIEIDNKYKGVYVIDTKWKNIEDLNPSSRNLQQVFAYMKYFKARKGALIYPGSKSLVLKKGKYKEYPTSTNSCSIISISKPDKLNEWQKNIWNTIFEWIRESRDNET